MPTDDVTFRLSISDARSTDMAGLHKSLENEGFRVESDGRSGFLLSAKPDLVESFFHSKIENRGGQNYFKDAPTESRVLKNLSFRVYFPSKPEYYS